MSRVFVWFVKITGWIAAVFYFKTKTYYLSPTQKKNIKGKAIIVSNHKSVMDYPLYMFVFRWRVIRTLTAEIIYKKGKLMAWFLKKMGCIRVDRESGDFGFMHEAIKHLNKNGVTLVFPEARLHKPGEEGLLEFKPSFVYMALETGAPIIPCYTNGCYAQKKRAKVLIGERIYLQELYDESKTEKENIDYLCKYVRDYINVLEVKLFEKEKDTLAC